MPADPPSDALHSPHPPGPPPLPARAVAALTLILSVCLAPPAAAAPARTTCILLLNSTALHITCSGPGPVAVDTSNPLLRPLRIIPRGDVTLTTTLPAACGTAPRAALVVLCSQAADLHLVNSTINSVDTTSPAASPPPAPTAAPTRRATPAAADARQPLTSTPRTALALPEGLLGAGAAIAILLTAATRASQAAPSTLTITNLAARDVSGGPPLFATLGPGTALHVTDSTFSNNSAPSSSGGGLALQVQPAPGDPGAAPGPPRTVVTLSNVNFTNNTAFSGGGLSLQPDAARAVSTAGVQTLPTAGHVLVTGCHFEGNRAVFGGGVYGFDSDLEIRESTLQGNIATWYGGGAAMESMQAFVLHSCLVAGNWAGHYGGGMFGAGGVGNTFNTMNVTGCNITDNQSEMSGGGIFLQRGSTIIHGTSITRNVALQQGGGIAFLNLCDGNLDATTFTPSRFTPPPTVASTSATRPPADAYSSALCGLQLTNTTSVLNNSALSAGGGLFIAIVPGGRNVELGQANVVVPAANNSAPYSPGISALPRAEITVNNNTFSVSSSTGPAGIIHLEASISQYPSSVLESTSTQLAVQFCDNQYLSETPRTSLSPPPATTGGDKHHQQQQPQPQQQGPPFLLRNFNQTRSAPGGVLGTVNFTDSQLRLLSGVVGTTYCLRVHAPDYPDVPSQSIYVTITPCQPGEVRWAAGCKPCELLTYSFNPNDPKCYLCPANAICDGGAVLVPRNGSWHSAFDSDNIQPCPNRKACVANRNKLRVCQAAANCTAAFGNTYAAQQCSRGYTGNLCGVCNTSAGYGQGVYFQCARCMPRRLSMLLMLVLGLFACWLVVFVARKTLAEADGASGPPPGGVVLVMDGYGGSWKAVPAATRRAATSTGWGSAKAGSSSWQSELPLRGGLQLPSLPAAVNREVAEMVRKLELSDVFKVLLLHLQYLTIVSNLLVEWPRALRVVLGLPHLLFFSSSSEIVSWDCLRLGNGAMMTLPIMLPMLVVLVACAVTVELHRPAAAWLVVSFGRAVVSGRALLHSHHEGGHGFSDQHHMDAGAGDGRSGGLGSHGRSGEGSGGASTDGGGGLGGGGGGGGDAGSAASAAPADVAHAPKAGPVQVSWDGGSASAVPAPAAATPGGHDDTAVSDATCLQHSHGTGQSEGAATTSAATSATSRGACSTLDRAISTVVVGVFFFYFLLVSTSLSAFACIKVDGQPYWIKDMAVRCHSAPHLRASLAVGVLGSLVFCLITPVATIWWLARNRRRLVQAQFKRRYGFLYRLYRPRYCFWEGVVCMQTIVLVCIMLFSRGASTYFQLVLLSGVLVLNYTLVSVLRPFRCRPLQWLYVGSTVVLLATSLGAQLVWHGNASMREATSVSGLIATGVMSIILLANVLYVVVCLYIMGRTAAKMAQKTLVTAATWVANATGRRGRGGRSGLRGLPTHSDVAASVDDLSLPLPPPQLPPLAWPKLDRGSQELLVSGSDPGSTSSRRPGEHGWVNEGQAQGQVATGGRVMQWVVEGSGGAQWKLPDQQAVLRMLGGPR